MGEYWVTLVGWLVVKHPVSGSLEGSSVASSSVEESGLVRLDELGVMTLALRDARVMRWTARTCLVMSCERVDE